MIIKHILFPVDFSERMHTAIPFVAEMAKRHDAKVTVLSVVHPLYSGGPADAPVIDVEEVRLRAQAELSRTFRIDHFAAERVPAERVTVIGEPGEAIARYAHEHGVDLIMMPTHGYGAFRRLILGSVTSKVLHDAHCPVWTDAHTGEAPDLAHLALRNLICAVDTNDDAVRVIRWAGHMAKSLAGGGTPVKLRMVHAVAGLEAWPERQMNQEFDEQIRRAARQTLERMQHEADLQVPICVNCGTVPEVIREEAMQHGADLIIIGRGVIQGTLGRLRTHAHAIISHSPCPVFSV